MADEATQARSKAVDEVRVSDQEPGDERHERAGPIDRRQSVFALGSASAATTLAIPASYWLQMSSTV